MPSLATTDWILIAGFVAVVWMLEKVRALLFDIHAEVMNIESNTAPESPPEEPPLR